MQSLYNDLIRCQTDWLGINHVKMSEWLIWAVKGHIAIGTFNFIEYTELGGEHLAFIINHCHVRADLQCNLKQTVLTDRSVMDGGPHCFLSRSMLEQMPHYSEKKCLRKMNDLKIIINSCMRSLTSQCGQMKTCFLSSTVS